MFEQFALEDYNHTQLILDAIKWGMAPFQARDITLWIKDGDNFADFNSKYLVIEIKNVPGDICEVDLAPIAVETWAWSDSFRHQVAQAVALHYRHLPRIDPPDNCVLGEE